MMTVFTVMGDRIYVAFPTMHGVPHEVQTWLFATIGNQTEWGLVNGKRVGVFLSGPDAIAFRLKFDL